ncbi:META domain-containing protein [Mycobacterium sp. URHB0044]|uniref:META domain-containing protein n=1 Tax=Mycobacterium sp. URHB0044 TaxID=1380386 RepID=UPI00048BA832|nr:META domain-containing protein [Mycobacterium sp. URHB0044]
MRLVAPPLVSLLLVAGCSSVAAADDPTPDGRTFVSVGVDGEQIPGGGPLVLGFEAGQVTAYAGCNHGSGPVDLADGRMTAQLATTLMGCPSPVGDADAWMTRLFDARPAWTLAGDTLTLTGDGAVVTLRDKKVVDPDRPLTDTTWLVESLVSAQAVTTSVVLEQARPTLHIAPDGALTGWTGCNHIWGHADLSGAASAIVIGPLTSTERSCSAELAGVEQSVLRALDGRVQTTIDADALHLTGPDGHGLILRAQ